MDRILVTGGAGFIGSHTVVELQNAGYEPIIIDNLSNASQDVIDRIGEITGNRPGFRKVDCCDKTAVEEVLKEYGEIKAVIHFAAFKAVGESIEKPREYYRNNIVSLLNILDLMPRYGITGIVFSSSCTVYGQPVHVPVNENSPIIPANCPYGNTKQICEEMIRDTIAAAVPIKSIILRYFNPIGAHPSSLIGELPKGVPLNLVPYITQTAIGIRNHLNVFGNNYNTRDGSCIRDYIDVVDLAKAHVLAVTRMLEKETDNIEVFNLGTGRGVSVLELIQAFEEATEVKLKYKIVDRRPGDVEKVYADCTKANDVLGWKSITPLRETLLNAWNWQKRLAQQ